MYCHRKRPEQRRQYLRLSNLFEGTIAAHNPEASFQRYRLRRPVDTIMFLSLAQCQCRQNITATRLRIWVQYPYDIRLREGWQLQLGHGQESGCRQNWRPSNCRKSEESGTSASSSVTGVCMDSTDLVPGDQRTSSLAADAASPPDTTLILRGFLLPSTRRHAGEAKADG